MITTEAILSAIDDAGLDWHNGWTVGDEAENRYLNLCRAIEALVRAECVPPGYVVVPVEPTQQMVEIGAGVIDDNGGNARWSDIMEAWGAMLATAPGITAPQGEQP